MIDVSELVHDPDFESDITILRTTGGHFEGPVYVPGSQDVITVKGVFVSPKNSKEIVQTPQGDRAGGFVDIYVDGDTPIYVTRENVNDENNISDIVIVDYNTDMEIRYRVTNVYDRSQWGYIKAEAQKVGASG